MITSGDIKIGDYVIYKWKTPDMGVGRVLKQEGAFVLVEFLKFTRGHDGNIGDGAKNRLFLYPEELILHKKYIIKQILDKTKE